MINTSFQPKLTHLFSNQVALEKLNQCEINSIALTNCIALILSQQFEALNLEHTVSHSDNTINITEQHPDRDTPETYHISLLSYPNEINETPKSLAKNHELLIFFTPKEKQGDLTQYLESLDDYGAPLNPHEINIEGDSFIVQFLERYYDFDTSTFNDYR